MPMSLKDLVEQLAVEKARVIDAGRRIAGGLRAEQERREQAERRVQELEATCRELDGRLQAEINGRPWRCDGPQGAQG